MACFEAITHAAINILDVIYHYWPGVNPDLSHFGVLKRNHWVFAYIDSLKGKEIVALAAISRGGQFDAFLKNNPNVAAEGIRWPN
jgi:hypothetical protein